MRGRPAWVAGAVLLMLVPLRFADGRGHVAGWAGTLSFAGAVVLAWLLLRYAWLWWRGRRP